MLCIVTVIVSLFYATWQARLQQIQQSMVIRTCFTITMWEYTHARTHTARERERDSQLQHT